MENPSIFPRFHSASLAFSFLAAGQLAASVLSREIADTECSTAPRLIHDPVAVASSPLPDPTPKPVVLPPAVVLDTVEYVLPAEGRSIFVQKTEPPPGYVPPPVHPPPAPPPAAPSEEFLARARAAAANRPAIRRLRFSATVYPQQDGTTSTLLRWTHERPNYRAWSSFDWNHFRGLDRFDSSDGKTQ